MSKMSWNQTENMPVEWNGKLYNVPKQLEIYYRESLVVIGYRLYDGLDKKTGEVIFIYDGSETRVAITNYQIIEKQD